MTWNTFLNSKITTFLLSIVLVLVMILTAKILVQKRVVDREIAKLKTQMEKVRNDNDKLSSLVKYFNTPEYQEKQARENLNLKKEGEFVVVLPPQNETVAGSATSAEQPKNYKLWFNYFFNHVN